MKYSIVIPTRNRNSTAPSAIKTAVECIGADKEVIVVDNGDTSDLRDTLASMGLLKKVTYFKTETVLSMQENWEFGLSKTTGDYIAFLGDDDGVIPYALCAMDKFLSKTSPDVVHCKTPIYNWPDVMFSSRRNVLYMTEDFTNVTLISNPQKLINDVYAFEWKMGTGIGIYHGFVKRSLIDKVRKLHGKYFFHESPDLASGFASLLYADKILDVKYPMFLAGHSRASNSGNLRMYASYTSAIQKFKSESLTNGASLQNYPRCNASYIVDAYLNLLPEIERITGKKYSVNYKNAYEYIAENALTGYESVHLKEIKNSLTKLAMDWNIAEDVSIPDKFQVTAGKQFELAVTRISGTQAVKDKKPAFNLTPLGIKDVEGAVKFVTSFLPIPTSTQSDHVKNLSELYLASYEVELENAHNLVQQKEYTEAIRIYQNYLEICAYDADIFLRLGDALFSCGIYDEAALNFARSFTIEKSLSAFEKYVKALCKNDQSIVAKNLIESYIQDASDESRVSYFTGLLQRVTEFSRTVSAVTN